MYAFVFHRHVGDGSFHIASERRARLLPGVFSEEGGDNNGVDDRVDELLRRAVELLPPDVLENNGRPPFMAKVSVSTLDKLRPDFIRSVRDAFNVRYVGLGQCPLDQKRANK